MQFAELRRWQDFRNPGSQGKQYFLGLEEVLKGSGDPSYPGQPACSPPAVLIKRSPCQPLYLSSSVCCNSSEPLSMCMQAVSSSICSTLGSLT